MADLFDTPASKTPDSYSAKDIEVLEGLEPVRRRPGMYVGGTDERGLHHLVAEVLDNAMDEAVAGHATRIEIELASGNWVTIRDNGRGVPVDPHPRFPKKSALEVILTTSIPAAAWRRRAYKHLRRLARRRVSVVNALSDEFGVEVARDRQLWAQSYRRGIPGTKLWTAARCTTGAARRCAFIPTPRLGDIGFRPATSTAWRAPRPTCSAASRFAGAADPLRPAGRSSGRGQAALPGRVR
jgi:topoisomerase-4 subunit B